MHYKLQKTKNKKNKCNTNSNSLGHIPKIIPTMSVNGALKTSKVILPQMKE
jgi:hypothetical protein